MTGWSIPCWRSESASAAISAGSKCRRGWNGFGSIWSTGTWTRSARSSEPPGSNPPSSRPRRASRPRPRRRLLFTVDYLHDEFGIGPGPPGPGRVIEDALAVAGRLADVDVARDRRAENRLVEVPAHPVGD